MDYIGRPEEGTIKLGDICVIYVSESQRYILKIEPSGRIQTKFGQVKAEDLLDHQYGVRFECKKGWILPLMLTPELWTQILPHRTQILYQSDISMILLQLDIKPGSLVVESGTGSGSLSHSLIRACRPSGFLYTIEVNESRVKDAQIEFKDHGFEQNVNVILRNVCEQGFGEDLVGRVDACMLDLPRTWDAIEHAYKILKPFGSRLCTFSPCIEQVKQNVSKMTELKMKDILTFETLLRPYEVRAHNLRKWDEDILEGLTAIDRKRFENLSGTLEANRNYNQPTEPRAEEGLGNSNTQTGDNIGDEDDDAIALKKALEDPKAPFHPHMLPKRSYAYPKQFNESVSHSGYLTFATKRP